MAYNPIQFQQGMCRCPSSFNASAPKPPAPKLCDALVGQGVSSVHAATQAPIASWSVATAACTSVKLAIGRPR